MSVSYQEDANSQKIISIAINYSPYHYQPSFTCAQKSNKYQLQTNTDKLINNKNIATTAINLTIELAHISAIISKTFFDKLI